MRALVARSLRAEGHEIVAEATDCDEAVAAVAREAADAVVVDSRLPGGGAIEMIPRLRAAAPNLAIFVVAALEERELVRAVLAAGARSAVARPLRSRDIVDAFAALARERFF